MARATLHIRFHRPDGVAADVAVDPGRAVVVGRDLVCDVRLDGRKVSRRHLRFENRGEEGVVLVDEGSHNGTFVNAERVTQRALLEGDLVQAGEWEGRVELRPPKPQAPGLMPAIRTAAKPTPDTAPQGQTTLSGTSDVPGLAALNHPATLSVAEPTDPVPRANADRYAGPTLSGAPAMPQASPPPRLTPSKSTTAFTPVTRVLNLGDWNWEEGARSPADQLRTARVEDNPIVRRLTESQVNLDFRGLSELSAQIADTGTGLNPQSAQAVDGIALRLVFKVTEALANAESMDAFLTEMCESLQGAARAKGVIVLLPDPAGELVPRAVKLRRPDEKIQLSRTVVEHAVRNRAAITTEDAAADARFARGESVLRFDLKAVLCAPLVKGDAIVGALYLTRDLPFSNTERDLVAALGQLIAMGLERSRLREEYAAADRTRRSLERFHAPDVVRRLMMETQAPASARGEGLFLEPLTATVLFCDLAGFTRWCEAHDAVEVGTVLNLYLEAMTEAVFAHGGTVDKFIGDAIMCIFGAPFMMADDPLRAVQCAVAMRRRFRELVSSGAAGDAARSLDVHIGVNTGRVVAGTVGSPRRMEYTALGDTVNIAARLEGVAKAGQIVLGPTTAALVRDQIPVVSMGAVTLKGKAESIEAFEVP